MYGFVMNRITRRSMVCRTRLLSSSASSSSSSVLGLPWQHHKTVVTSKHLVSTRVKEEFGIPLTVADVHLRQEQLPFAYFFPPSPTDLHQPEQLLASLSAILPRFPVLGGSVNDARCLTIQCQTTDSIPCTFATSDQSLDYWLMQKQQHNILRRHRSPYLLPLFDSLVTSSLEEEQHEQENLATIQITQLQGGGTVIGMTVNHMAADAASCFHFLECWGNQHQAHSHERLQAQNRSRSGRHEAALLHDASLSLVASPIGKAILPTNENYMSTDNRLSNDRSLTTWSGMMTDQTADAMGLFVAPTSPTSFFASENFPWPSMLVLSPWNRPDTEAHLPLTTSDETLVEVTTQVDDDNCDHEYIHLAFSSDVLIAMKAHGMAQSRAFAASQQQQQQQPDDAQQSTPDFVSSNDMITAFGWLMKRELSGQSNGNVSMVVNLRGRCGVDAMADDGLFGNGIVNFIASMPDQVTNEAGSSAAISMEDVSAAALAIRNSLIDEIRDTPDRLSRSRLGQPPSRRSSSSSPCFSTTAWGTFSFWNAIDFGTDMQLAGFHGQPSHPMPPGDLFASVIVPNNHGSGFTYQLLAPKNKERLARRIHKRLSALFLAWHSAAAVKDVQNGDEGTVLDGTTILAYGS